MRKNVWIIAVLLASAGVCLAAKKLVAVEGKLWLGQHPEPATVNVHGSWNSRDWGRVVLTQADGSREVGGTADGWTVTGVVAGRKVYLLFSDKGRNIEYSAELEASNNALIGFYTRGLNEKGSQQKRMELVGADGTTVRDVK